MYVNMSIEVLIYLTFLNTIVFCCLYKKREHLCHALL